VRPNPLCVHGGAAGLFINNQLPPRKEKPLALSRDDDLRMSKKCLLESHEAAWEAELAARPGGQPELAASRPGCALSSIDLSPTRIWRS
jgi:hypothetical protein